MNDEKFNLSQIPVKGILGMIEAGEYVIPEIQRPFVWKRSQVRDLIDSLYNGYPTGYIITWKNPNVRTKDGKLSNGMTMLIDGQQRITALMAALLGREVLDDDFKLDRIKIAFNPMEEDVSKKFDVQNASHFKDKQWIPDIAEIFDTDFDLFSFCLQYCKDNPEYKPQEISKALESLRGIANRMIGVITLEHTLDIDEVTEIFIRINSKGTALNQSDFVMSKMAADMRNEGHVLRKAVDYFSHLAVKPEFYDTVRKDKEFMDTEFGNKVSWLAKNYDDIYDPDYGDILRVSFMHRFKRGKLKDLVSLLSGRDFETKEFKDEIIVESYDLLRSGILDFMNEYNFEQFVLAIKGAGFVSSKLLTSQMTLDFAYTLYLLLHEDDSIPNNEQIKRYVQKWFILSTLTGRYITSTESIMDKDIRSISEKGFIRFMSEIESSELSDAFWDVTLPLKLESSSVNSPAFNTFLAAQIRLSCNSLLMEGTRVEDLVKISGDIHHIFPKEYLKRNGYNQKSIYNQVANYIYLDTQVNKSIGMDSPDMYFHKVLGQLGDGEPILGNISDENVFRKNLEENAIPYDVIDMNHEDYTSFLETRRKMMSEMIKKYYLSL